MADPAQLVVNSLAEAIQAFMEDPAAIRLVVVNSVEVSRSAALRAFLDSPEYSGIWDIQNSFRLHQLVKVDRLLSAIAIDVLPVLVADPTSPTLSLLSRYGVKFVAPTVGGQFEERATAICEDLVAYVNNTTRRHPARLTAADLLRRLNMFRSERVTIADSDPAIYCDAAEMEAMRRLDNNIHANSFRRLASLREEDVDYANPDERRVIIQALPASHSSALIGVALFEGIGSDWVVSNLMRLRALSDVDVSFQLLIFGVLPFLRDNPGSEQARQFLVDYVRSVMINVRDVGGEFVMPATILCTDLIATRLLPPHEMMMVSEDLRGRLQDFRCRDLSIPDSPFTDDESDDADESDGSLN